eukprot:g47698.t1
MTYYWSRHCTASILETISFLNPFVVLPYLFTIASSNTNLLKSWHIPVLLTPQLAALPSDVMTLCLPKPVKAYFKPPNETYLFDLDFGNYLVSP